MFPEQDAVDFSRLLRGAWHCPLCLGMKHRAQVPACPSEWQLFCQTRQRARLLDRITGLIYRFLKVTLFHVLSVFCSLDLAWLPPSSVAKKKRTVYIIICLLSFFLFSTFIWAQRRQTLYFVDRKIFECLKVNRVFAAEHVGWWGWLQPVCLWLAASFCRLLWVMMLLAWGCYVFLY